ncbi:nuclear receptor-binding protein-like isoform X1 [Lates japonicus]|uniref:Nuclear receptor-binding protein-like isoform X1 n=1 Tax=Lates japonicus TaxID=270547 RepID=A0AAD3NCF3_LATJO|nr:nuclear receptor-binding protein-like isoform X1 [Lates japonicus]
MNLQNSAKKLPVPRWVPDTAGIVTFPVFNTRLLGLTKERMSEGENKQAPDTVQEAKPESMAATPTGQGVSSVTRPVSMVTQSPATAATEDEEEESEDESEILEESPCGRWQKRAEKR